MRAGAVGAQALEGFKFNAPEDRMRNGDAYVSSQYNSAAAQSTEKLPMNRCTRVMLISAVGVLISAAAYARSDDGPELELKPCTIELVDGTEVAGKLAVQFDMDDHLIVYSPRLATVRSFLKDHVHALTVDCEREELNPKRELTEEDRKLLGQVEWPDAPPAEGHKPAYTTETWEKPKRLMVWAKPGRTGRFGQPGNWLMNGERVGAFVPYEYESRRPPTFRPTKYKAIVGPHVDMLIPAAGKRYSVRLVNKDLGSARPRHVTVESNGGLTFKLDGGYGNVWVSEHAEFDGGGQATIRGVKHTFIVGGPRMPEAQDIRKITNDGAEAGKPGYFRGKHFARKLVFRKDDPKASVELIGSARTGDETQFIRGVLIVSEDSLLSIGPRCTQTIFRDAVIQMQDGAILAKHSNYLAMDDMAVFGTLRAGGPYRPIARNCYVGLSSTDWQGTIRQIGYEEERIAPWWDGADTADWPSYVSLRVGPGARIETHSADPDAARLVFCSHGKEGFGDHIRGVEGERQTAAYRELLGRISIACMEEELSLNGVSFRDMDEGGLVLPDIDLHSTWKNVSFGDSTPEKLVTKLDMAKAIEIMKHRLRASAYCADVD